MMPSPTFHRSSTDPFKGRFYDTVVSGREVDPIKVRTYGDIVEVPFDPLGDLVGELAAHDWQAVLCPAQCMNLPPRGQY